MAKISIGNDGSIEVSEGINIGTYIGPTSEPVNTGNGDQVTVVVHDTTHVGPGVTYVAGDNHSGISRSF